MNRRQLTHLAGVIAVAIAARVLLFESVAVWADFGFWAYDSRLIMNGQRPFIDFPGRSPLMVYLLAVVRAFVSNSIEAMRATVIVLWLLTAPIVYLFARDISGHRAGLLSVAALLLTPFSVSYGMWLNSQALGALLGILSAYVVFQRRGLSWYAVAGGLLGGAFLARRSTIVLAVVLGLFTLYRFVDRDEPRKWLQDSIVRGGAFGFGGAAILFTGYFLVAGGIVSTALAVFQLDFVGLFSSGGRGAYPLLGVDVPPTSAGGGGGLGPFNLFCQSCGAWTARRGLRMAILSLPVSGVLAYYGVDIADQLYTKRGRQYLAGALVPLWAYAVGLGFWHGFGYRSVALISLAVFVLVALYGPSIPRPILYRPGCLFIGLIIVTMIGAYLYRDRRILVYYMLDVWPYIAILAGVIGVAVWDRATITWRTVLAIAVITAFIVSVPVATPLAEITLSNETHWFSIASLSAHATDLSERTDSDDRVLSANPAYVAGSDARLYQDNSRIYQAIVPYESGALRERTLSELEASLRNGDIEYVVMTTATRHIIDRDPGVRNAIQEHYQGVETTGLYTGANRSLYRYDPNNRTGIA